jgi:hypothetical protein
MRGQGHRPGAGIPASVHGVLAAVLVVIGLLGMHGLSTAHTGMAPAPAGMHTAAAPAEAGHGSPAALEGSCPTEPPCPVAASGSSCVLAPPAADGGALDLPAQAFLPAAAAVHAVPSYRGPPPAAPSLHQLSISRT